MAQATPSVADFKSAISEELTTIQDNLNKGGEGSLKDATYVCRVFGLCAVHKRPARLERLLVVRAGNLDAAKEALVTWSTWRATHPIGWVPQVRSCDT